MRYHKSYFKNQSYFYSENDTEGQRINQISQIIYTLQKTGQGFVIKSGCSWMFYITTDLKNIENL